MLMPKVYEAKEIAATPDAVWAAMGRPETICEWHPAIAMSSMSDAVRHCTLVGGGEIDEAIVEHSDNGRFYVYIVTAGPFDVPGYRSRMAVEDAGTGARVVWSGQFEASDPDHDASLSETLSRVYRQGLEGIRSLIESA
jgi:Polyketide cyclase / dehydrase and lipid transport